MSKQLNIKIEKCNDCPYCRMTYIQATGGRWEDKSEFLCKKAHKYMKGDKKSIPQDCPLDDKTNVEKISHAAVVRSDGILEIAKSHPEIIKRCPYGTCKDGSKMGFVTSLGRYVDRKEAMTIAIEADQINKDMDTLRQSGLISENIWADTDHKYDPEKGYYIPDPIKKELAYVLGQIINDLPKNKDWLDPALEKSAVAILKDAESK